MVAQTLWRSLRWASTRAVFRTLDFRATRSIAIGCAPSIQEETRLTRILIGLRPLTISTTRLKDSHDRVLQPPGRHDLDDGLPVIRQAVSCGTGVWKTAAGDDPIFTVPDPTGPTAGIAS